MTAIYDSYDRLWDRLRKLGSPARQYAYRDWDLSGVDFSGQDFGRVHFPRNCRFTGAQLAGAIMARATLEGADLSGCDLREVELSGSAMNGARLDRANLAGVQIKGVHLAHASLRNAVLDDGELTDGEIQHAVWQGASLARTKFRSIDAYASDFRDADLTLARFEKSDISGIRLDGASVDGLIIESPRTILRAILPGCSQCGGPTELTGKDARRAIEDEKRLRRENSSETAGRCPSCAAHLTSGDMQIRIEGVDGKEVARVIREVRSMQSDRVIINVSGGQIGNLNLGTIIGDVQNRLTALRETGAEEVAVSLRQLAEAVIESASISEQQKRDTTEQIDEVARQAQLPAGERRPGIIRATLVSLGATASAVAALKPVWTIAAEALGKHFGIPIP